MLQVRVVQLHSRPAPLETAHKIGHGDTTAAALAPNVASVDTGYLQVPAHTQYLRYKGTNVRVRVQIIRNDYMGILDLFRSISSGSTVSESVI